KILSQIDKYISKIEEAASFIYDTASYFYVDIRRRSVIIKRLRLRQDTAVPKHKQISNHQFLNIIISFLVVQE
ncbi:hypothetical protein AB6805_28600, partial [Chitinophaga sp. RCC_12]|uniref:hypothetical protein n=1 Tax=Chitinophaga sp. RCC_12 TaxID=3239226 RepID=UPI003523FEBD